MSEALESIQDLNGKELVEWWRDFTKSPTNVNRKDYDAVPYILKKKLRYYIRQWIDVALPEFVPEGGKINLCCLTCKRKGVAEKESMLFLDPTPSEVPMIFNFAREEIPQVIGTTISRWVCPHCGEKS
jgi:hypothetical protein